MRPNALAQYSFIQYKTQYRSKISKKKILIIPQIYQFYLQNGTRIKHMHSWRCQIFKAT